jgi:hypothetical protein
MADGVNYRDLRQPFVTADMPAITLAATQKMLWAYAGSPTQLPANYWFVGKTVKLSALLKFVTGATPGNLTLGMMYGAADAAAPNVTSEAIAANASLTKSIFIQGYATCRSVGTSGTLAMWGCGHVDATTIALTGTYIFPIGGVTVVSTIDTTVGTNHLCFQAMRSGSTAETIAPVGLTFEALN